MGSLSWKILNCFFVFFLTSGVIAVGVYEDCFTCCFITSPPGCKDSFSPLLCHCEDLTVFDYPSTSSAVLTTCLILTMFVCYSHNYLFLKGTCGSLVVLYMLLYATFWCIGGVKLTYPQGQDWYLYLDEDSGGMCNWEKRRIWEGKKWTRWFQLIY